MNVVRVAPMPTRTILLINSEPTVRELLQACLIHLGGWQVCGVNSPVAGLECATQAQPDAIVFDLSTFGMSFFTFLKRLRGHPMTQGIPVILIATGTKWLNIEPLQQFQLAGVIDYAGDPARLPQQIAQLLNWEEDLPTREIED